MVAIADPRRRGAGRARLEIVLALLLLATLAAAARPVHAQADACALLTLDDITSVTGASEVETYPSGGAGCAWLAATPDGETIDLGLQADVIDAAEYLAAFPTSVPTEVAGYPAYEWADSGVSNIAVQLPDAAPFLAVSTFADLDASAMAVALLVRIIERLAPTAPVASTTPTVTTAPPTPTPTPAVASTPEPPTPTPTLTPTHTPTPEPPVDLAGCRAVIRATDLSDPLTIVDLDACRSTDPGRDAAAELLTAGGTRDQTWAAVRVYSASGTDPGPLLLALASDDASVRALAAAALLALGEPAAFPALAAALDEPGPLLGANPSIAIRAFVLRTLDRYVAADAAPTPLPGQSAADAWSAWLIEQAGGATFDPTDGRWRLP